LIGTENRSARKALEIEIELKQHTHFYFGIDLCEHVPRVCVCV
jgi:hypothetical protein